MVEFCDAGMCCWPVWDGHFWIIWLFDCLILWLFFFLVPFFKLFKFSWLHDRWMPVEKELFVTSTVHFLIFCDAPISPCIHWLSTHPRKNHRSQLVEASQQVGSLGWLYGQNLELWCASKWLWNVRSFSFMIFWWNTLPFQKVCSHSSGMGFIDTKAGALSVDAQSRWLILNCVWGVKGKGQIKGQISSGMLQ